MYRIRHIHRRIAFQQQRDKSAGPAGVDGAHGPAVLEPLSGSLALAALTSFTLSSGSTEFEVGGRPNSHSTARRNPAGLAPSTS